MMLQIDQGPRQSTSRPLAELVILLLLVQCALVATRRSMTAKDSWDPRHGLIVISIPNLRTKSKEWPICQTTLTKSSKRTLAILSLLADLPLSTPTLG
jgi:hypothetical protein